jgi:large subunit ribosomal protein L9
MKVYLRKDIEKVGIAGEIIKVGDGYGRNFLIPRGFAVEVTKANESFYQKHAKQVEHRKDVIESKTSMLAERINSLKLALKRKMHDDGKLYGAISPAEIVDLLAKEGVNISKSQVKIDKSIKSKGSHTVTIKLTSKLQAKVTLVVQPE